MTIPELKEVLHAQGLSDEAMEKMSTEEFITYLVKHDLGDEALYECLRAISEFGTDIESLEDLLEEEE